MTDPIIQFANDIHFYKFYKPMPENSAFKIEFSENCFELFSLYYDLWKERYGLKKDSTPTMKQYEKLITRSLLFGTPISFTIDLQTMRGYAEDFDNQEHWRDKKKETRIVELVQRSCFD